MRKRTEKRQDWSRRSFVGAGSNAAVPGRRASASSAAFQGQGGGQGQNAKMTIARIKAIL